MIFETTKTNNKAATFFFFFAGRVGLCNLKTKSNFKNRGRRSAALAKRVCRAADPKWLLTQTVGLLLHQFFKGRLSSPYDRVSSLSLLFL